MVKQDTTLGLVAHLLGLLTWFIGPLIIYLVGKDKFTKDHARNALNWQISLIIYFIIAFILVFVFIGVFLMIALAILNLVFSIIGMVKASEGKMYAYPMTIPFIKQ